MLEQRQDRRLKQLERDTVMPRQGVVTGVDPLMVSIGGSDVAVACQAIDGAVYLIGDRVTVLCWGRSMLVVKSGPDPSFPEWDLPALIEKLHAAGSAATATANLLYVGTVRVRNRVTVTGVGYQVGGTSNGNVRSALFGRAGSRVANRSSNLAQAGALALQQVPFTSPVELGPGIYHPTLIFSSSTGTFLSAAALPASTVAQGSFANPSSISPPTSGGTVPSMWLY